MISINYDTLTIYKGDRTMKALCYELREQRRTDRKLIRYDPPIIQNERVVFKLFGYTIIKNEYATQNGWTIK